MSKGASGGHLSPKYRKQSLVRGQKSQDGTTSPFKVVNDWNRERHPAQSIWIADDFTHTRDLKEWIRKHAKWPFYTFYLCNLHASNRMVKKGDRRKEAVHVPKLQPVKHLSNFMRWWRCMMCKKCSFSLGKATATIHPWGARYVFLMRGAHFWRWISKVLVLL